MKVLLIVAALVVVASASRRSGKIVGGSNASPGAWPWQASLQTSNGHTCGASLISTTYLVCAAHCVGAGASNLAIILGMHDRGGWQGDPVTYPISRITSHPRWTPDGSQGFPNDIAMIQLSSPASLNSYVATIALPAAGQDFQSASCFITGWGRTVGGGSLPDILQQAPIDVLSQSECQAYFGNIIQAYHTCVFDRTWESAGSCNGDSGGPLSCQVGGTWYLAGATSFGIVDCPTWAPSVYASVPHFRSWIREVAGV